MNAELLPRGQRFFQSLRLRAGKTPTTIVLVRLIFWRFCILFGLHPVIRAHDHARLRIFPKRGDHGIAKGVFLLREGYEPSVCDIIDKVLRPDDVALDIGANMGFWTLRMAERVGPKGRVFAFEPGPETQKRLRDNLALSGSAVVELHAVALGAEPGELALHTPHDSGSASLGVLDEPVHITRVPVVTLDDIWKAAGCPQAKLVKIDVEGAEPMVLAGAVSFFGAARPVVCCEINPVALRRLGFTAEDINSFFRLRSYRAMVWNEAEARLMLRSKGQERDTVEDIVFVPQESNYSLFLSGAAK